VRVPRQHRQHGSPRSPPTRTPERRRLAQGRQRVALQSVGRELRFRVSAEGCASEGRQRVALRRVGRGLRLNRPASSGIGTCMLSCSLVGFAHPSSSYQSPTRPAHHHRHRRRSPHLSRTDALCHPMQWCVCACAFVQTLRSLLPLVTILVKCWQPLQRTVGLRGSSLGIIVGLVSQRNLRRLPHTPAPDSIPHGDVMRSCQILGSLQLLLPCHCCSNVRRSSDDTRRLRVPEDRTPRVVGCRGCGGGMGNNQSNRQRAGQFGLPPPQPSWPEASAPPPTPQPPRRTTATAAATHPAMLASQALRAIAPPPPPLSRQAPASAIVERVPAAGQEVEVHAEEVEEITVAGESATWHYVPEVMSVRLGHVVHLLETSNAGALPFPRNVDPEKDLRWIFVGFSMASRP